MQLEGNTDKDQQYIEKIKKINGKMFPIESYIASRTKIDHKCINCGSIRKLSPNTVLQLTAKGYTLCQECGGKAFRVGKNDLWTTHPEIAKLLVNPDDGYHVTKSSNKKFDWVCPKCGTIIRQKSVNNTVRAGLSCAICSKGRPMGHKIINAILEVCNIDYQNEVSFEWSQSKRYDVYINNDCIIEVNGEQHYKDCWLLKLSNKTIEDEKANDIFKKELAIQNGIKHYITIDASQSNYQYIIDNIQKNKKFISYINDYSEIKFENIDWKAVFDKYNDDIAWRVLRDYSNKMQIKDIAKKNKINVNAVSSYLKLLASYGYCDYKPEDQLKQKVRCITTGEEFDSMTEAGNKYNIHPMGIYRVCRGLFNRTTAGKLPDGTRLTWEYI